MKEYEVTICIRMDAESQKDAEGKVEKWLNEFGSTDELPPGIITGGIVKKNPPSNQE